MNKTTMSALLMRPLTSVESKNFELYLKIAYQFLDQLLCYDIKDATKTRVYDARDGYSTVFIEPFYKVSSVKLNGSTVDASDYTVMQWDRRNADWYNSIVFDHKLCQDDEVEVVASWGFGGKMPKDLQYILAGLFGLITKKNKFDGSVTSKRVEDFQISFDNSVDLDGAFYSQNRKTITKYSLCDIDIVRHGKVRRYGC